MSNSEDNQSSLDVLQKNTLIIPTFNRHEHLTRLIRYYSSKKSTMSFLILDSSQPEIAQLNRQSCLMLGDMAKHVIFDESIHPLQKIVDGLKLVATPFCTFCADDDIIFINALSEALSYLENHDDCACVDGVYLSFRVVKNNVQLRIEYSHGGLDARHPVSRVFRLLQKYESLFYGACRTSQVLSVFTSMNNLSTYCYQEFFQSVATLLLGKKHRLPIFYSGRQACDRADPSSVKWNSHNWLIENPSEIIQEYLPYRCELWKFYEKNTIEPTLSHEQFNRSMDLAHVVLLTTACSSKSFYSSLQHYCPNDNFLEIDPYTYDLSQFKKPYHRKWDTYTEKALKFMQKHQKKIASLFYRNNLKELNVEIQRITNTKWDCGLRADLKWLSTRREFREAYKELCLYLGQT